MTSLEDFLNKNKPLKNEISGDNVSGTFTCMDCGNVTQNAFLNYEQKSLLWICKDCNHFNRIGMNV